MLYRIAALALTCMTSSAFAECHEPAYVGIAGSRVVSAAIFPLSAALTVVSLPAGVIGAATDNENLKDGTRDTFCYTTGFATHALVGHPRR
jgi:hypothetical protein